MNVVRLLLTLLFLSSCQNPMTETGYSVAELNHVEFSYKDANGTMNLRSPTYIAPTYFDDISVGPGNPTMDYSKKKLGLVNIALSLSPSVNCVRNKQVHKL